MLRKLFIITALLLISSTLNACTPQNYQDLSGIISRFENTRYLNGHGFSDFQKQADDSVYISYLDFEESTIMLKLTEDENTFISSIEIYLPKTDSSGNRKSITENQIAQFFSLAADITVAFLDINYHEAEDIISALRLKEKTPYTSTGEITLTKDNYRFVFFSTDIGCELVITDTFIKEIETTHKPESKPAFWETTRIREAEENNNTP